jgi:hypothetical protein
VAIGAPVVPGRSEWREIVRLRDAVRGAIIALGTEARAG